MNFRTPTPQQYRIFRRIWRRQPETALLLIGDPKQAIYAFRGADIFTYMKARGDVAAHYTLDTNWRSSPGMVGSVNRLFSLSDNPFMFHEIPFLPVKAAAKNKGLRFTVDAADVPAMNVWLMPGDTVGSGDYQTFMAQLCATQIRDWLSAGQRGRALLWRGETSRPVQASDITVLVRNRLEAAQVREALQTLGIPSVYLSNRDSVFETLEAQELLWLLQAVLAPERENTLRSALATSMFGLTALDIEKPEPGRAGVGRAGRGVQRIPPDLAAARSDADAAGVDDSPTYRRESAGDTRWRAALNRHSAHQRTAAGRRPASWKASMPLCAGWRSISPSRTATPPASRCVSKAISTWCKLSLFTSQKGWNTPGLAAVYRLVS